MNEMLNHPFSEKEVEQELFIMGPSKAPGVDGFTAGFFQRHWEFVREAVVSAVLGFLNGGEMPPELNRAVLVLIPKVN